jgi:ribosomal protein S18 acetylase RimI-like enzyme
MKIRQALSDDVDVIVAFNAAMAEETESRTLDMDVLRRGVAAVLTDPSKGRYLVADQGSKIIGQLMITYEWSDWRNGTFWWIQSVYVMPEYRRRGIYRALHEYVMRLARQEPEVCGIRLYVDRHNVTARKTYESLGMRYSHYDLFEIDFSSGS